MHSTPSWDRCNKCNGTGRACVRGYRDPHPKGMFELNDKSLERTDRNRVEWVYKISKKCLSVCPLTEVCKVCKGKGEVFYDGELGQFGH